MKKLSLVTMIVCLCLTLCGCDQVKQLVADLTPPPTPVEISRKVDELVRAKKYEMAISTGEQYLNKNADDQSLVIDAVTNAYMASGDTSGAVRHMQRSSKKAEATESVTINTTQTDGSISSNSTSISTSKDGSTILRAGDAIVVFPK